MEIIRHISEIDSNPWMVLILGLFAFIISSLITTVLGLVLAPLFGSQAKQIRIFGLTLEKESGGKWAKRDNGAYPGFFADFAFDLEKLKGVSQEKLVARESAFVLVTGLLSLLVSGVCAVFGVFGGLCIESDFMASNAYWLGIALFIFAIVRFGVRLYVLIKVNSKNSLGGYAQAAFGKIRMGIPMAKLDLKPMTDPSFKKVTRAEKLLYFPVYFSYLDASGQYDLMAAAVGDIENEMRPRATSRPEIMVAGTLVYYYSYHYIDVRKAKDYYHRTSDFIEKDRDSNSLRIQGFYNLNCFGDVERAIVFLNDAKAHIDSFSSPTGSERDYERTCIAKLEDAINRFLAQR